MSNDASIEVWPGYGNVEEFVVVIGEPVTNLAPLTRVVFCADGVQVDSAVTPECLWWTDSITARALPNGDLFTGNVVKAVLGLASLSEGEYEDCRLIIYSDDYPDGLVVSDKIHMLVNGSC